jgi:type II secretory pathway pseudopilin PulG
MSTTTHPFSPEEVMAFLDGELTAERAKFLSSHIGECAECSTLAAGLRGFSRQMTSWQVEVVPERINGRVEAAAENYTRIAPTLGNVNQRRRPTLRFAVQVGSAIGAVLLVMALAIPNLLRSRMAANEASAVGSLRTLNTAAVTYLSTYGHFPPTLRSFGPPSSGEATEDAAGLIDPTLATGRKSGYLFTYRAVPGFGTNNKGGYRITADPLDPRQGGQRHFSTNQTGTIFADGFSLDDLRTPEESSHGGSAEGQTRVNDADSAPMIARRAELKVLVEKLEDARQAMDRILAKHKGYVAQLSASAEGGSERTVAASLRVPADQLDACLAELKKLGRVIQESQAGEEVTQQHVDLVARLKNSRNTEARLSGVLEQRSGPVKEILEVEKESARVRGEIEQMEAEQQNLEHRVSFATIDLKLAEEYKAQLTSPAPSAGMQLRNAIVNGFRNASESLLGIILFFAEAGPTLLLWLAILFIPARLIWRRYQRAYAMSGSS